MWLPLCCSQFPVGRCRDSTGASPVAALGAVPAGRPRGHRRAGSLVLRIRALARRQPAARSRILRAVGVELASLRHSATRDGRPLDLSVKEFAVLEALMRACPAFLTAEDLLEQVRDENADPFTNAVFVTISRLRRKLGDPPVIETQPGVGYHITG